MILFQVKMLFIDTKDLNYLLSYIIRTFIFIFLFHYIHYLYLNKWEDQSIERWVKGTNCIWCCWNNISENFEMNDLNSKILTLIRDHIHKCLRKLVGYQTLGQLAEILLEDFGSINGDSLRAICVQASKGGRFKVGCFIGKLIDQVRFRCGLWAEFAAVNTLLVNTWGYNSRCEARRALNS